MEKRYDFQKHEKETQEFWEREGIYRFSPDAPGRVYSIDTPPPHCQRQPAHRPSVFLCPGGNDRPLPPDAGGKTSIIPSVLTTTACPLNGWWNGRKSCEPETCRTLTSQSFAGNGIPL